jgi:hypothetical protein
LRVPTDRLNRSPERNGTTQADQSLQNWAVMKDGHGACLGEFVVLSQVFHVDIAVGLDPILGANFVPVTSGIRGKAAASVNSRIVIY